MPAPETVRQLVQRFEEHHASYRSGRYNETQLRREFLDPLFEALGWDVFNRNNYAETYKEVIHEDSLEIEGATKAPDYAFRIGGPRKFFVEAKKPAVNIEMDVHPAFQLRRYAWSAKLPLGILTDFEEFAVYDCKGKPDKKDKASTGRVALYSFREYAGKWDEIAGIFSREAVLRGSFDSYADGIKAKKGTAEVDDAFLAEIERWREALARNFALRNPKLSTRELNYAVQMTIDRIIFLRICEDRGIERYGRLKELVTSGLDTGRGDPAPTRPAEGVYQGLVQIFQQADARYNSGLFHFSGEKNASSAADSLTLSLNVDDKVLKEILGSLYYPESPYVFSEIPSDILGQVYERFLGKVIRLTAGHQAKVEEKPEVRKAGGVYYTPTYIVDYIVKNTVGKLLDPTPAPSPERRGGLTPREVSNLKILDPACGSGTFPLGAFQYLLDWHLKWYIENDLEKSLRGKKPALYESKDGYRLTTAEKKRILLNNIYGVDIDPQAVEVTKLSLLLKVLEGESEQTIGSQLALIQERALPDLGRNIKCGNSLIGPDYYEGHQLTMGFADDEERYRVNAFDWKAEFPQVFIQGGFDVVIGNPPYGALFSDTEKEFLKESYTYKSGKPESYVFFIEKTISLLKQNGVFGFIIPNAWLTNYYGQQLRKHILNNCRILQVVNLEPVKVFSDAIVDTVILTAHKEAEIVPRENIINILEGSLDSKIFFKHSISQKSWQADKEALFNIMTNDQEASIIEIMLSLSTPLSEICEYSQGIIPYKTKEEGNKNLYISTIRQSDSWKPLLDSGNSIDRYSLKWNGQYIHYGNWLWCQRDAKYFEEPKILFHRIRKKLPTQLVATFDESGFYNRHSLSNLISKPDMQINMKYVLGIFNSRLLNFWFAKRFGLLMEVGGFKVEGLPIYKIDFSDPADKARHDKMVSLVERMLELHKKGDGHLGRTPQEQELVKREIESTDRQIDRLVYELYGLTEEEVKIVENS